MTETTERIPVPQAMRQKLHAALKANVSEEQMLRMDRSTTFCDTDAPDAVVSAVRSTPTHY
ncbi:MAG TPA: hypothetical protein VMS17_09920 [Gemmataceae bacterium]|nr:hypothetical protein [Gemmataceae bacterium]